MIQKKRFRWRGSWKKQGRMKILMPGPLHAYNSHMGGVDLFDQCLANYRSSIRTKKWRLLFQWGVDASRSNPWLLSRSSKDSPQLPFIRYMAKNLMKRNTVPWPRSGYKGKIGAGIGIGAKIEFIKTSSMQDLRRKDSHEVQQLRGPSAFIKMFWAVSCVWWVGHISL